MNLTEALKNEDRTTLKNITHEGNLEKRVMHSVDTVADLGSVPSSYKVVFARGYHEAGDGGGGTFIYDDVKGWIRQRKGIVTAECFGVRYDGTDESALIHNAMSNGSVEITKDVRFDTTYRVDGYAIPIITYNSSKNIGVARNPILDFSATQVLGNVIDNPFLVGDRNAKQLLVGGVLRRDISTAEGSVVNANNWFWINDSAHIPLNIDMTRGDDANTTQGGCELVSSGLNLKIYFHGKKLHTLNITPDETMAKKGVRVGNSTGYDNAVLSFFAHCECNVDLNSGDISGYDADLWASARFNVSVATSGYITINHPGIVGDSKQAIIEYRPRNSVGSYFDPIYETTGGSATNCFLLGQMEGVITNGDTVSSSESIDEANYSFSWDSSTYELTVTHPSLASNTSPLTQITQYKSAAGAGIHYYITASSKTYFKVAAKLLSDGSQITNQSLFAFFFNRGKTAKVEKSKIDGTVRVKVGTAQIVASQISSSIGNFWVSGVTQI